MDFMNHILILQWNLKGPGPDGYDSCFNCFPFLTKLKHTTSADVTGSGMICLIQ